MALLPLRQLCFPVGATENAGPVFSTYRYAGYFLVLPHSQKTDTVRDIQTIHGAHRHRIHVQFFFSFCFLA